MTITQLVPFQLHGVLNKACGRERWRSSYFGYNLSNKQPRNEPASRKALHGHRLSVLWRQNNSSLYSLWLIICQR